MGPVILLGKVIVGLMIFIWLRATFPRIRYDRLMAFGWKVLVPAALVNTAVTAILVVLDVFPGFVTV
jgi:NADH-quinone oxidoreductase subunit H